MTDHQADGHIIDAIPQDDGHNNLGNEGDALLLSFK
jgi:hypothetical protein